VIIYLVTKTNTKQFTLDIPCVAYHPKHFASDTVLFAVFMSHSSRHLKTLVDITILL